MESKSCAKCGERKPLSAYHRNAAARDGLQAKCKPCHIATVVEHQRKNPDPHREANRKYRATSTGAKESDVKWRAKNPERAKEFDAAKSRRWRARNKGVVREITRRHQFTQSQATPAWADMDAIRRVYIEGKKRDLEVDHIVPINSEIVCGLHVHANLQLLDGLLNKSKGNKQWPDAP